MKRVVIIGANGFVGPYLTKEFAGAGYDVKSYGHLDADILNRESINALMAKDRPDYLVNLAAMSSVSASWKNPTQTMQVNVNGTLHILDAVQANAPTCKVLLVGSSEEYAPANRPMSELDPVQALNPYGISKIAQENFASLYREKYGMKIVCTRSFNHTGIGQRDKFVLPSFCKQVAAIEKSGKPGKIYVGNLSVYRDISDVRDVVHVYRLLLENGGEHVIFNVGSGKAHKIEDLLKYIISLSSQSIEIVPDPERIRPVENPYICCDNTRIREYWGGIAIEETIQGMVKWYSKEDGK